MKTPGITRTVVLSLLLGSVVLACAAQDRPSNGSKDKDHPKQDSQHQQAKHEQPREQRSQPSNEEQRPAAQQRRQPAPSQPRPDDSQRQAPQARQSQSSRVGRSQEHVRQQRTATPAKLKQAQQHVRQTAWQQHRVEDWQSDHRTWQQRGGYHGYRIPDDRFRGYFGPDHGFRTQGLPFMVVGGYPRFQYEGYWLSVVDPWPANWSDDWYRHRPGLCRLRGQRLLPLQPQLPRCRHRGEHFDVTGVCGAFERSDSTLRLIDSSRAREEIRGNGV